MITDVQLSSFTKMKDILKDSSIITSLVYKMVIIKLIMYEQGNISNKLKLWSYEEFTMKT